MPAPTITKVGLMSSLCVGYVRGLTTRPTGCTCEVSSPPTVTCTAKPGGSATTESSSGWAKSSRPWSHVLGQVKTGQPPTLPSAARCTWPATIRRTCPWPATTSPSAARSASVRPIASHAGMPSSSGGWCMATMVGVSRLLGQARVEPGQALRRRDGPRRGPDRWCRRRRGAAARSARRSGSPRRPRRRRPAGRRRAGSRGRRGCRRARGPARSAATSSSRTRSYSSGMPVLGQVAA